MKKSIIALSVSVMLAATLSFNANAQSVAVDCDTAQEDIAHLQHEKKSTDDRIAKGVFSIMPIGLALNATASIADSGSQKEMEINEYNERLSQRIDEIKQACGIK